MSVYEGNRDVSDLKFEYNAIELRTELNKFLVTNQVPKSWRFLVAVPMSETARSIIYNINRAESFFPSTTFNVLERKRYFNLAIADCNQLLQDLESLKAMGGPVNVNSIEALIARVDDEIKLLKGVRNSTRLRGKRDKAQIIADAEAELERARSL